MNYDIELIKYKILAALQKDKVALLPPMEANESISLISTLGFRPTTTIIDPWYNKGIGGVREDYIENILEIIENIKDNTGHFFLWGFPEIVALFVNKIPKPLEYRCWLTWYYKNNPSVIRGWRSSQQACLHYSITGAKMYPENFFNPQQQIRFEDKKMRFIPGPSSVIEEPLLVGFIGKDEQTGHPSQKPVKVYEKLILMTTKKEDIVFDPMCGSGTTGQVCKKHGSYAILSDISEEYTKIVEERLNIVRIDFKEIISKDVKNNATHDTVYN